MENTEKAHAVPQNIMSVEFKLIGDLSLKQFVFIAVPLTLGFIMYVFHVNNYITLVFTGFLLLIALFIDFVPIDDRPLDDLIVNFLIAIKNPTQRVWRKNPEFPNILKIPKMLIPQEKKDSEMATFMYQSPIDSNLNTPSSSDASKFLDQREKVLIDNIDKLNDSLNSTPSGNSMVSPSINNNIPTSSLGSNMNPPFVNPVGNINNNSQNNGNMPVQNSGDTNPIITPNPVNNNPSIQNPNYNNQPVSNNIGLDNQNLSGSSAFPNPGNVNMLDPLRQPDPKDFYKQSPGNNIVEPINTASFNGGSIPTIDPNMNPQNPFNSMAGSVVSNGASNPDNAMNTNVGAPINAPVINQNYNTSNSSNINNDNLLLNNIPPVQNGMNNIGVGPSANISPIVQSNSSYVSEPSANIPPIIQSGTNDIAGVSANIDQGSLNSSILDDTNLYDNLSEPPDTSSVSVDTNAIPHSYDYLSSSVPTDAPKIVDNIIPDSDKTPPQTTKSDNDMKEILEKLEKLEKENNDLKKQVGEKNEKIDENNKQNEANTKDLLDDTLRAKSKDEKNPVEDTSIDTAPITEEKSSPDNNISDKDILNTDVIPPQNSVDNNVSENSINSVIPSSPQADISSQSQSDTGSFTNSSQQGSLKKEDILKYLPDFVSNPNIISGVVMKSTGEILPDTVIIIKDSSQKPVRAIKTNQLGQFFIRTPLLSGMYNLEITYQGLNFDPIFIDLNDTVKEPMLIYSK